MVEGDNSFQGVALQAEKLTFAGASTVTIYGSTINTVQGDAAANTLIFQLSAAGGINLQALQFVDWTDADSVLARGSEGDDEISAATVKTGLDGMAGNDRLFLSRASDVAGITVNLAIQNSATVLADGTWFRNFEAIHGTFGSGNDHIAGGNGLTAFADKIDDRVFLGAGNDTFTGRGGNDFASGDLGNDEFSGGDGNDELLGGDGADALAGDEGNDSLSGGSGDDILDGGAGSDRLSGGADDDRLTGAGGNDELAGDVGDDILLAGLGNDTLEGGSGNDVLNGGGGDDQFLGGSGNDQITSTGRQGSPVLVDGGAGFDFAFLDWSNLNVSFTISLTQAVVQLADGSSFGAIERIDFRAGSGNDNLTGGIYDDVFSGGDGLGRIAGGGGNDSLSGGDDIDTVSGGDGNDNLNGDDGVDTLDGGSGDDRLGGGAGADTLDGGAGRDTAFFRDKTASVVVKLSRSSDAIVTVGGFAEDTLRNVENVTGGSGNDALTGDGAVNVLDGSIGNDTLNGGAGNDTMIGGLGNDTFVVDSIGDRVEEANGAGTGIDTVRTSVSYSVASQFVENMVLLGSASISAIGNNLANTITGNAGDNAIDGRGGADLMQGGLGDDTYYVDNALDRIFEANGAGTDTVNSSVSKAFFDQFIEVIRLTGSANINTTGNNLANTIVGNGGNNGINGSAGNDTLAGGFGRDSFVFNTALGAGNIDSITDYNVADDTIQLDDAIFAEATGSGAGGLGTLLAEQFRANATGLAQDADDRIIYETDTGRIFYDSNGNAAGGNVLFADLASGLAVTAADFLVI